MRLLDRPIRSRPGPFDPAWDDLIGERDPHWSRLSPNEAERMRALVGSFVGSTRWEAARGFSVTEEMRVLVAAQACLLLLGLDEDDFGGPSRVILHPSTVVLRGRRSIGVGRVETSSPHVIAGQAHHRGPILLSWASVRSGLARPGAGHNVVYHEFAHRLDMLDGMIDGTPPIRDRVARDRWAEVCTAAFAELIGPVDGQDDPASGQDAPVVVGERRPDVLRPYATTNPGEFFAVATEVFLTRPHALRERHPDLYRELVGYYRQDPADRLGRPGAADPSPPQEHHDE